MKFGVPWSVKGIRPEARESAKEAARRSGVSLGEWLNTVILHQASETGVQPPSFDDDDDDNGHELAAVHARLDDISRRLEQFPRSGPAAYAPKAERMRDRDDNDQIADLIARLDKRLDQFVNTAPVVPPPVRQPAMPSVQLPPGLDRAVAEIAARQRALNGQSAAPVMAAPVAAPSPVLAPVPTQDLSGLEDQLRKITNQIETLRKPGVEEAINALRAELGDISHALTEAMPRHAIDAIEHQIQGLNERIAEGRQAGVDGNALSGVEHGLAEVRDALRELTPAENLVGFNDAVAGLAHKIDLIVGQKDPATLAQLEHAITTLRDMATHVASDEAVGVLAEQVHSLGQKVDQLAHSGAGSDALNNLEHRISALSDALEQRARSGDSVPPMLESLVQSLSEKIELIQQSRGDNVAVGHLEDRIVSLVQRLDASDSRLGHLEAIERGLADLLVHIEDIRANKNGGPLRADNSPGVDALKHDIARTQDALDAVNGTLGLVVDRLAGIERDIRGEPRQTARQENRQENRQEPRPHILTDEETAELRQPVGKLAVRMVNDAPPLQAAIPAQASISAPILAPAPAPVPAPKAPPAAPPPPPKRLPPAATLPINPDLPPDQPLDPGSGPPPLRAGARISASEAPGSSGATSAGGQSGFIAAARRAAQAAIKTPSERAPLIEAPQADGDEEPSLRGKMMKRVKSLFVAASIIGVVVGSLQIASNFYDFGGSTGSNVKTAQTVSTGETASTTPETTATVPNAMPAPLSMTTIVAGQPLNLSPVAPIEPSLLSPPLLDPKNDVTGSISRPGTRPATPAKPLLASAPIPDQLPIAIGGSKLRSAAVAGDGPAAYEVALRFSEGRGVPANLEAAALWFERASAKGLAPAQFRYASLLEKGQGGRKDLSQARKLYLAAAAKGNAKAMHNLAVLYAEGIDGKPDYVTAAQWFRKAALRGVADSQYNLGVLCARGLGIEKNVDESYKWFALAAAHGDKESAKKRDEIAERLDPAALQVVDQAVKDFTAEPQPDEAIKVPEPAGGWEGTTGTINVPHPHAKPRNPGPLSLGSFEIGKR